VCEYVFVPLGYVSDERSDVAAPAARRRRASVARSGAPEASRHAYSPITVLALCGPVGCERVARSDRHI
jgi:hypothetical protein